jgi:MFS family permease
VRRPIVRPVTPSLPARRSRPDRERIASLVAAFAFSVSLGVGTITIPLLALSAGYDAPTIGFLAATAAALQLGTRFALPWLLGRFRSRELIALASAMMFTAFGLLFVSTALPVFIVAQLLQGSARAIFWTSSQTHAIRDQPRPVERLVDLNVAGNAGTLVGPVLAGLLATLGLSAALIAACIGALVAACIALTLRRLEPFDRARSAGTWRLLKRDGVDVACWASVVGGLWWSMMGSFIPVILVGAGIGSVGIGWLVTASEGAGTAALLLQRGVRRTRVRRAVRVAAPTALVALAALAIAPASLPAYALILVIGGAASGTVTTLAPAMATLVAGPQEHGDALSLTGTFRAGALFASPAAIGALLGVAPLGAALALAALAVGLPGLLVGRSRGTSVAQAE